MSTNITTLNAPSTVEIALGWTPAETYTYAPGGGHPGFSAPRGRIDTPLTFHATAVSSDPALTIVEYYWDFGDGTVSTGNPVTHTYRVVTPFTHTGLRVTDSLGRRWFARAQMYLA